MVTCLWLLVVSMNIWTCISNSSNRVNNDGDTNGIRRRQPYPLCWGLSWFVQFLKLRNTSSGPLLNYLSSCISIIIRNLGWSFTMPAMLTALFQKKHNPVMWLYYFVGFCINSALVCRLVGLHSYITSLRTVRITLTLECQPFPALHYGCVLKHWQQYTY